jgi:hypothetical protein
MMMTLMVMHVFFEKVHLDPTMKVEKNHQKKTKTLYIYNPIHGKKNHATKHR